MNTATEERIEETETSEEYSTSGRMGRGRILKTPKGARKVEVAWNDRTKRPIKVNSTEVDLKTSASSTLREALDKACHCTGFLPLYEHEEIKGPVALVLVWRRPGKPESGYASIIKRGTGVMKFDLSRVSLEKMECATVNEALRKIAFVTGAVRTKD
jgi:hypothetical protein